MRLVAITATRRVICLSYAVDVMLIMQPVPIRYVNTERVSDVIFSGTWETAQARRPQIGRRRPRQEARRVQEEIGAGNIGRRQCTRADIRLPPLDNTLIRTACPRPIEGGPVADRRLLKIAADQTIQVTGHRCKGLPRLRKRPRPRRQRRVMIIAIMPPLTGRPALSPLLGRQVCGPRLMVSVRLVAGLRHACLAADLPHQLMA